MRNEHTVIAWWSGGVTSAVACKIAQDLFTDVKFIFIDTKNEDDDTYRFLIDCEKWYGHKIERLSVVGEKYNSIQDVWYKYLQLNTAHGAICSSELKRAVRLQFEKENEFKYQVFGFDIDEPHRANSIKLNYPKSKPIFPLLLFAYSKKDCIQIVQDAGIKIPYAYTLGFNNNNCLKTGCIQGGIGYWQKYQRTFPDRFDKMAQVEHELTNLKGKPVTMLKDQGKNKGLVFLKPHPNYPHIKDISMMEGREPKPLLDCNGFCGTNDLKKNSTELELNFTNP